MIDLSKKIKKMIQPGIEILGYELIDVECHYGKKSLKITVFIDHINSIHIDDCVKVTNTISPIIDEDVDLIDHYKLEVSSPGLNRKLILEEHYDKFIGNVVKVKLKKQINDRKTYKGKLIGRIGDEISIFENNKQINIQMDVIELCRLVPNFDQ